MNKLLILVVFMCALSLVAHAEINNTNETNITTNQSENTTIPPQNDSILGIEWNCANSTSIGTSTSAGVPSFNVLPNSTKIATYKTADNIQSTGGSIYARTSPINSTEWSKPYLLFGDGGINNYDQAEIVVFPNDSIMAISSKMPQIPCTNKPENSCQLVYKMLNDTGIPISSEKQLPNVVPKNSNNGGYAISVNEHYTTIGNRVHVPVIVVDNSYNERMGSYYTDDNGSTWAFAFWDERGWQGVYGAEGALIATNDTNIFAIWRDQSCGSSRCEGVWTSTSSNRGANWTNATNIGQSYGGAFPWLADPELTPLNESTVLLTAGWADFHSYHIGTSFWIGSIDANNNITWQPSNSTNGYVLIETTDFYSEVIYHGIEKIGDNEVYLVYQNGGAVTEVETRGISLNIINNTTTSQKCSPRIATRTLRGSGSSSGGGDGGGGVLSEEPLSNITNSSTIEKSLFAGKTAIYNFSSSIYRIDLEALNNEDDMAVKIDELSSRQSKINKSPDGNVYKYFNIYAGTKRISGATIYFKVPSGWDNASLVRWNLTNKSWDALETTRIDDTHYNAHTSGFSGFAILRTEAQPINTPPATTIISLKVIDNGTVVYNSNETSTPTATISEIQQTPKTLSGFGIIIAFVGIIILYLLKRKK